MVHQKTEWFVCTDLIFTFTLVANEKSTDIARGKVLKEVILSLLVLNLIIHTRNCCKNHPKRTSVKNEEKNALKM